MFILKIFFIYLIGQSLAFAEVDCYSKFHTQKQIEEIWKIKHEMECSKFYDSFSPEFKKNYGVENSIDAADESYLSPAFSCSGLFVVTGISVAQKLSDSTKASLMSKVPKIAQFITPKIPYFIAFGSVVTIYSILDLTIESFEKDKLCFEDIEKKKAAIELLDLTGQHLVKETEGVLDDFQKNQLLLPKDYKEEKFIKNLTCQNLKEIMLIQKRKQDTVLGPLVGDSKKFKDDPRKYKILTEKEEALHRLLLDNLQCLSTAKKLQLFCSVGNATLGGLHLKNFLSDVSHFAKSSQVLRRIPQITPPVKVAPLEKPSVKIEPDVFPRVPLNKFVEKAELHQTTYSVNDFGFARRFEVGVSDPIVKRGISTIHVDAGRKVVYPNFQKKMGVKISADYKTVTRPSDSATHNSYIENYNIGKSEMEQVSIRLKDDYSPNGMTDEAFVRLWSFEKKVPLNQANQNLHIHDNEFHVQAYQMIPHTVVERSTANFGLVANMLDGPAFKNSYRLKEGVYSYLGGLLDRKPLVFTSANLERADYIQDSMNVLILNKNELQKIFLRFKPTRSQLLEIEKMYANLKEGLSVTEANQVSQMLRRRVSAD